MREFLNTITGTGAGVTLTGAASGQLLIGAAGLFFMVAFGAWSSYLKWKDSRAIREALDSGDLEKALKIRSK